MMHFQEILVHAAVTPKQIAKVLYIFASVLYPIKAETSSDTATHVNNKYIKKMYIEKRTSYF